MKLNRILPLVLATLAIAACQKDDTATTDTAAPAAATATTTDSMSSSLDVGDIDMGRAVGADNKITDKTDDFAPTDKIFASVHTKGGATPMQLVARWTFQDDSTVVAEDTQSVQPGVESDNVFKAVKAGGWAKGKYTVHILADGKEVKTKEVTVK